MKKDVFRSRKVRKVDGDVLFGLAWSLLLVKTAAWCLERYLDAHKRAS